MGYTDWVTVYHLFIEQFRWWMIVHILSFDGIETNHASFDFICVLITYLIVKYAVTHCEWLIESIYLYSNVNCRRYFDFFIFLNIKFLCCFIGIISFKKWLSFVVTKFVMKSESLIEFANQSFVWPYLHSSSLRFSCV